MASEGGSGREGMACTSPRTEGVAKQDYLVRGQRPTGGYKNHPGTDDVALEQSILQVSSQSERGHQVRLEGRGLSSCRRKRSGTQRILLVLLN
jgi:hypothetical protein